MRNRFPSISERRKPKYALTVSATPHPVRSVYSTSYSAGIPGIQRTGSGTRTCAIVEAAAAGTPSLLVEGSCAAECVRDGENGFLCEDDPKSIRDTIARVIAGEALRRRVGEAARETIPIPWSGVIQDVRERYLRRIQAYDTRGLRLNEK
ncbi:hypothetical protein SDC9_200488 [bioreactor metagenome]|uniref:Glycosyl transferase family 1 domain-containing protein n=1 Tax=bioreactor metagenome TaxID=1076179 RepID=A0A645INA1_9ZZZZ